MYFTATDIDHFHVELRSIFDYLVQFMGYICDKRGQTPNSFHELRNWLEKSEGNKKRFGKDLTKITIECDWFKEIRSIRDTNIHEGGWSLVFPEENRILFQTSKHLYFPKVKCQAIMFNKEVADFELYAGRYLTLMLCFLEHLAKITCRRLGIDIDSYGLRSKSYHPGYAIIKAWIGKLAKKLKKK